jgi:hypothetical protein
MYWSDFGQFSGENWRFLENQYCDNFFAQRRYIAVFLAKMGIFSPIFFCENIKIITSTTGAKPSQYGSVFGAAHLSAFVAAPIFGRFGVLTFGQF